jgi:leader peptidase (prepilin peptidase)/N-methyltransferase
MTMPTLHWMPPHGRIVQYCGLGLTALATAGASIAAAPGLPGIFGAGLSILMLAIAVTDARNFIIPNSLNAAALVLGLLDAASRAGWDGALSSVLRGAALALSFLIIRAGYRWLRGRQGIGLGDVKLAGVAGAWLDWTMMPIAVEVAALAALAIYTLHWLRGGQALQRTTRVPFGLFLAPAIWLCWMLGTGFASRILQGS